MTDHGWIEAAKPLLEALAAHTLADESGAYHDTLMDQHLASRAYLEAMEKDADSPEAVAQFNRKREDEAWEMVEAEAHSIMAKCSQYWNEPNIGDAEIHAVLEFIHTSADRLRSAREARDA